MSSLSVGAHSRRQPARWAPARQGFAAWRRKAGLALARAAERSTGFARFTLTTTALGFLDAAAYYANIGVGLAATGVSLAVLEWAVFGD
jgi:hypothetical protein